MGFRLSVLQQSSLAAFTRKLGQGFAMIRLAKGMDRFVRSFIGVLSREVLGWIDNRHSNAAFQIHAIQIPRIALCAASKALRREQTAQLSSVLGSLQQGRGGGDAP